MSLSSAPPHFRTIARDKCLRVFVLLLVTLIASILSFSSSIAPAYGWQPAPKFSPIPRLKPLAPGPRHLSQNDYNQLKAIIKAVEARRWTTAKSAINRISNPQARSLGQWYYFDARDPNVSISDGSAFLDAHQGWPSLSRIQTHLESRLSDKTPIEDVFNLFSKRDPLTGNGKIQFIRTLMARGDREAAKIYLADSWVNHRFSSSQERTIIARYGSMLSVENHIGRVDNLLWARQVSAARRQYSRLPSRELRKARARDALYVRAGNAVRLYNGLPASEKNDPGVVHAAIRYYRRGDQEGRAIALARTLPDDPIELKHPARLWSERQLLMRGALKDARFADAYAMTSRTGLTDGLDLADAEFNAGWIALRFLNETDRAEKHFLSLAGWATSPISSARAYYWLGRTAKASNNSELAKKRFAVAAQHIYTYYGQLAAEELGGVYADQRFVSTAVITDQDRLKFDARPGALAFRMISDLNHRRSLLRFSYSLDDQLESAGEYLLLKEITSSERAPNLTVRAGKAAVRKQKLIPEMSYPLIHIPEAARRFVDPELTLGLSRQESEFNPVAVSRANARGIMQLLPSTAQITARKEGLRYSRSRLLDDPDYNITIGSAHLSHLIERFNGSWIMTFVGYNAGPHRATQWVERYGDPRSLSVDPVDWVELIPFSETRNYVQRVLENVQVYRAQLNDRPIAGQLRADLERGGKANRAGLISPPSARLNTLRPADDRKALPRLSSLTQERANLAPLKQAGLNPQADHLTLEEKGISQESLPALQPDQGNSAAQKQAEQPTPPNPATIDPVTVTPNAPANPAQSPDPVQSADTVQSSGAVEGQQAALPDAALSLTPAAPAPAVEEEALLPVQSEPKEPGIITPSLKTRRIRTATIEESTPPQPTPIKTVPSPSPKPRSSLEEVPFDPYTAKIPGEGSPVSSSDGAASSNGQSAAQLPKNECNEYRDFIAENIEDKDESAEDLNAAMLAQLRGDDQCPKPQAPPAQ